MVNLMYCPVCEMYEETPIMHSIGPLPKDAPIMEGFEGYCSIECYLEAVPNDDIIEALNKIEAWIEELS